MAVFGKKRQEPPQPYQPHDQVKPSLTSTAAAAPPGMKNSVIGKTLFIKGKIFSDEEVFIEGKIQGKLNIKHRVIIGKNGVVNADIEARELIIIGTVNGNVKGSYKVEIVPDGVLNGNILAHRVVLAEGAVFKGSIDMTINEEEKPGEKKETDKVE